MGVFREHSEIILRRCACKFMKFIQKIGIKCFLNGKPTSKHDKFYVNQPEATQESGECGLKMATFMEQLRATWLKAEIQKGMDDIAAGKVVEGDTVFAALRKQVGVQNR